MKRYIVLIIAVILFIPKVNAAVCDNAKRVNYQKMAQNISTSYDYVEESNTFNIILNNVPSSFYFYDVETYERFDNTGEETVISNAKPGTSYKLSAYVDDIDCFRDSLYTLYINLPYYNPYYEDSLCNGFESYTYCQKFISRDITREQFETIVKKYKQDKEAKTEQSENNENSTIIDSLLSINSIYYIIAAIVLVLVYILIRRLYDKKHDLF